MKKEYFLYFLTVLFFTSACNREPANKEAVISDGEMAKIENLRSLTAEEGSSMLKLHCFTCHNPQSPSHDEMLAPPLAGIKWRYQKMYPDRSTFIARMTDFVSGPTEENALMKGPVRRFGLMPKPTLGKDEIRELAGYIFDHKLEVPEWFAEHFEEEQGKKWEE